MGGGAVLRSGRGPAGVVSAGERRVGDDRDGRRGRLGGGGGRRRRARRRRGGQDLVAGRAVRGDHGARTVVDGAGGRDLEDAGLERDARIGRADVDGEVALVVGHVRVRRVVVDERLAVDEHVDHAGAELAEAARTRDGEDAVGAGGGGDGEGKRGFLCTGGQADEERRRGETGRGC